MKIVVSDCVVCCLELDRTELNTLRKIAVRHLRHGAVVEASPSVLLELASELEVFDDFDSASAQRAVRAAAARIRREVAAFQAP